MFDCGINVDTLSFMCIGIALACICLMLYFMSGHTSQISSIEQKLDIVMRKIDMFAKIIHIMSEVSQDSFEAELAKQAQELVPMDNLDVQEIRAVDEEKKETATATATATAIASSDDIVETVEADEELVQ